MAKNQALYPASQTPGPLLALQGMGSQLKSLARFEALLSFFPKQPSYLVASLFIPYVQVAFDYPSHLNMVSVQWSLVDELFAAEALYLLC